MQCRDKQHNLRRLEAQRNELNTKGTSPPPSNISSSVHFVRSRGWRAPPETVWPDSGGPVLLLPLGTGWRERLW